MTFLRPRKTLISRFTTPKKYCFKSLLFAYYHYCIRVAAENPKCRQIFGGVFMQTPSHCISSNRLSKNVQQATPISTTACPAFWQGSARRESCLGAQALAHCHAPNLRFLVNSANIGHRLVALPLPFVSHCAP